MGGGGGQGAAARRGGPRRPPKVTAGRGGRGAGSPPPASGGPAGHLPAPSAPHGRPTRPMAIAEETEVVGSLPPAPSPPQRSSPRRAVGFGATARPPSTKRREASPTHLQPFCKLASPLQEMEATHLPPPGLHVEAQGGRQFEAAVGRGMAQSCWPLPCWCLLGLFCEEKVCPMATGILVAQHGSLPEGKGLYEDGTKWARQRLNLRPAFISHHCLTPPAQGFPTWGGFLTPTWPWLKMK